MPALPADLRRVLDCAFPPEDSDELAAVLPIIKAACPRPEYLPWAELHKRTHGVDLLACPCGGRRRVVAFVSDRERVGELLERLGAKIHARPGPIPKPASRSSDRPRPRPPRLRVPPGQRPLPFATDLA